MNDTLKNFLETNIDLLESNQTEFFFTAYNALSGYNQTRLVELLDAAGLDTYTSRERVFYYVVTRTLEDIEAPVQLRSLTNRYFAGALGFTTDAAISYILDNKSEWDSQIKLVNGVFIVYPSDDN